jgi:hypothetical protein
MIFRQPVSSGGESYLIIPVENTVPPKKRRRGAIVDKKPQLFATFS